MSFHRAFVICIGWIAFLLLAITVSGPNVLQIDQQVLNKFIIENGVPRRIADTIGWTMRTVPVLVMCLIAGIYLALTRRWWAVLVVALVVPVMSLSIFLKEVIASPRPGGVDGDWGFPAGRVGNAVLLSAAIAIVFSKAGIGRWLVPVVWVGLVSWARLATGSQWPSDIVGAWLWTVPVVLILASIFSANSRNGFRSRH